MPDIMTPGELQRLNALMISRGAPMEYDDQGYNKFDYDAGRYYYGLSSLTSNNCYKLAKMLTKYAKTQLGIDKQVFLDTTAYYEKKSDVIQVLRYDAEGIWTSWEYSKKISNTVKATGGFRWNKTKEGVWECLFYFVHIEKILHNLDQAGADTSAVKEILEEAKNSPERKASLEKRLGLDNDAEETMELVITRRDIDYLSIDVPLKPESVALQVRAAIKELPFWRFDKDGKFWQVDIDDVPDLFWKLAKIERVDFKGLKKYMYETGADYTLKDFSHLKRKPRDFQVTDASELIKAKRHINANDMGCGKTFEMCMVGTSLPFQKLVIAPAGLKLNWVKEIKMVDPEAEISVVYNSCSKVFGKGAFNGRGYIEYDGFFPGKDWTIIGYPSLDAHIKALEQQNYQVVMADEAHYLKAIDNSGTPDSNRAYMAMYLFKTAEYAYPITGTPKTSKNKDLFNLLKTIKHPLAKKTKEKGSGWYNFAHTYCDAQHNGFGWSFNGNTNDNALHDQIKDSMVRHLKSQVLPHLKKNRQFVPVEIDLRAYRKEIDDYMLHRNDDTAEQLVYLNRARYALAVKKVVETIELADSILERVDKITIGTNYTEVVEAVMKHYGSKAVKIVGGMTDNAKEQAKTSFQEDPNIRVCVCNLIAGGVGITLTAAYNTIINDFYWLPGDHLQFEDRICREGQVEEFSNIFYLYASGAEMDELLADIMDMRLESINNSIDGGKGEDIPVVKMIQDMLHKGESVKSVPDKVLNSNKKAKGKANVPPKVSVSVDSLRKMSTEDMMSFARDHGVKWVACENSNINRMRLAMAIKKKFAV